MSKRRQQKWSGVDAEPAAAPSTQGGVAAVRPQTDEAAAAATGGHEPSQMTQREWLAAPARFLPRDIEWLEFNARVLSIAEEPSTPLLERVRFLSIFGSNLDEFFMKRVGHLRRAVATGRPLLGAETLSPAQLMHTVRTMVQGLAHRQTRCWHEELRPQLRKAGIEVVSWEELSQGERDEAQAWFAASIFPILTPLAVDPGHRFPFISNGSVSLGLVVRRPGEQEALFARVKVPVTSPRMYQFRAGRRFISVRQIIEHNLDELFPGMEVVQVMPFRVTRDAEIDASDDDHDDLLHVMERALKERRFARVVRLEIAAGGSPRIQRFLCEELEIGPEDVYECEGPLDWNALATIADLDLPELRYPRWTPLPPRGLEEDDANIFAQIRKGDILLHHPYDSFELSVERFIEQAALDPKVLCIKQSLYRTSGDSPFVESLARAAESGKQVAVLVELRARFDEERNIEWARRLEDAGAHVAYGVVGFKTHTKTALVVRQEASGLRSYGHIGTGNYNSRTASLYEDIGLLTCDPAITEDLIGVFNYMTGRSRQKEFRKLLIAPISMKQRFLELIEREAALAAAGRPARIIAKMNQLEDRGVMDALYRASAAGVRIDLIVRGFCCLRPGVPGLSENIRVRSTVGRFLEHSRIFYFSAGAADPTDGEFFISSADWMYRNLQTRVEAAAPISLLAHRVQLWQVLTWGLEDTAQSWEMNGDGSYRRAAGQPRPNELAESGLHNRLMEAASASYQQRRLSES